MELINDEQKKLIFAARKRLHEIPELSGAETKTKAFITDFLSNNTTLEIHDMGSWLYAAHREGADTTVAFRADFDAIPTENGPAHRCGHDGHTAALLAFALMIEGKHLGKNVILLFQYGEETGEGGAECCKLFDLEKIDLMLGCHNIPGEPIGAVLLKKGTFACASCGMEVRFSGKPTHAAYPENGVNPTPAVAKLALELPNTAAQIEKCSGAMTIATIVGMYSGERAFGVAAANGAVYATLRSERGDCLDMLIASAEQKARELASDTGVECRIEFFDKFPATVNPDECFASIEACCKKNKILRGYLDVPFRWSEDFGHYGAYTKAFFFGIGSGTDTAPLHTEGYEYPDELAVKTAKVFYDLLGK